MVSDEWRKAWVLSELIKYLPASLIDKALTVARELSDADRRESAISAILAHFPDVEEAIRMAQALEIPYHRAGALLGLLPRLSGEARDRVLQTAMETVSTIPDPGYRAGRWIDILPFVTDPRPVGQEIVESMLDYLWAEKDERRGSVLSLCASDRYCSPSVLPPEILRTIGQHVLEITMLWKWQ